MPGLPTCTRQDFGGHMRQFTPGMKGGSSGPNYLIVRVMFSFSNDEDKLLPVVAGSQILGRGRWWERRVRLERWLAGGLTLAGMNDRFWLFLCLT